jgi:thiol-disulfide isomerase/thioredoxin
VGGLAGLIVSGQRMQVARLAEQEEQRIVTEQNDHDVQERQTQTQQARRSSEFKLYGKTLDNEDFNWDSLQGKYVLVKFTATWCPPCRKAIPGMLDMYEKYHDKGFEIVSVYIKQDEPDPVATVRKFVKNEKLTWMILSEALTARAGQPPQGSEFAIQGVPTFFLIDKEGKILVDRTHYLVEIVPVLKKLFGR